mmetsp:Transcript_95886/g.286215  ORF Transcript_95886/g.286215 Transcript_95886/m.286215 type:complete len:357 (-) Transcript_95886:103-1173(-)
MFRPPPAAVPARRAIPRSLSDPPIVDRRSGERYTFDELGRVPFVVSATVICLRQRPGFREADPVHGHALLREAELASDRFGGKGALPELMRDGQLVFRSGWQVLVGQSTVVNYMKSTSSRKAMMRFPGEWLLAGGARDPSDASLRHTAVRELEEEFLIAIPPDGFIFPFNARQTRRIKGKSNLMVNFVALAEQQSSPWLAGLDLDRINAELSQREDRVEQMLRTGEWDRLSKAERERLSPEVHQLAWLDIEDCVRTMQRSIAEHFHPVNQWQAEQFALHGLSQPRRSPVSVTMASIVQLELAGPERALAVAAGAEQAQREGREEALLEELVDDESFRFSSTVHALGRPSDFVKASL